MSRLAQRIEHARAATTEGRGLLTTTAALHPVDPELAGALLPSGLRLHPDRSSTRLLIMLSRNHFTSWFGDMDYHEAILGVPDVTTGAEPPSVYFRRLYLDQMLPRRLGNLIYGWEKLAAVLEWDGLDATQSGLAAVAATSTYRIRTKPGASILSAAWTATSDDIEPGALDDVLAQPVLSQTARRWRRGAATTRGGPFARTLIASEVVTDRRAVTGAIHFGSAFDPPALGGLRLDGVRAITMQATQVVGLPQRVRP